MRKLSKSTATIPLGEIMSASKERGDPATAPASAYIGLEHIEKDTAKIVGRGIAAEVKSTKSVFREGDLLYGKLRPYLNKVWLAEFDGICSTDILVFPKTEFIENKFLKYRFLARDFVSYANANSSGVNLPRVNLKALSRFEIDLPPLPEQRRIVARIEELFSRLDAGVAALRHAKAQLQRYRQSVLAAAVTGQLTQAWREEHPDTEPAEELLERILKQRREQWHGRGKFRIQESIPLDGMPEIPSSWVWAPVASICELENGDRGKNYPSRSIFTPQGIPFINAGHLESGTIQTNQMNYIPEDRFELLGSGKIGIGDLLFCLRGSLGKCAINAHLEKGAIASSLVILRSNQNVERRFILTYLQSSIASAFIKAYDNGSAQPNLSSASLAKFLVPLAPLAEQHQIVAEVESRTTAIDHLEAELDRQISRASRLRQAILANAFSGEGAFV